MIATLMINPKNQNIFINVNTLVPENPLHKSVSQQAHLNPLRIFDPHGQSSQALKQMDKLSSSAQIDISKNIFHLMDTQKEKTHALEDPITKLKNI